MVTAGSGSSSSVLTYIKGLLSFRVMHAASVVTYIWQSKAGGEAACLIRSYGWSPGFIYIQGVHTRSAVLYFCELSSFLPPRSGRSLFSCLSFAIRRRSPSAGSSGQYRSPQFEYNESHQFWITPITHWIAQWKRSGQCHQDNVTASDPKVVTLR